MNEYAEALTAINGQYAPQGEALWLQYQENPAPTMADVQTLMDATASLRLRIDEELVAVEAPEQIAELHSRWAGWHSRLVAAEQALAARASTVSSLGEFVQAPEMAGYLDTLKEGKVLCAEVEGTLDSTDAQELFADTAWMPSELTDVVNAVIGCEAFPDDIDEIASLFTP